MASRSWVHIGDQDVTDTVTISSSYREELDALLAELAASQTQLEEIFHRQDWALAVPQVAELQQLAIEQTQAVERLQAVVSRRSVWLQRVTGAGQPADSVTDWVHRWAADDRALCTRLAELRAQSERVRRQSWRQWVVIQSAYRHHTELLHLVARCGRQSVGYGQPAAQSGGGAILDASA